MEGAFVAQCAVIQAVYDGDEVAAFLESVRSVTAQRSDRLRINYVLAVDGPVRDELERAIAAVCHEFSVVLRIQRRSGLAFALNRCIETLGDEEFVFRMDSDDVSLEGRFLAQVNFMRAHDEIDVSGTSIIEQDVRQDFVGVRVFPKRFGVREMSRGVPMAHPTVCFRRRFFHRYGVYPLSASNQDIALWFRALEAGARFGNLDEPHLVFRYGRSFAQRRGVRKAWDELKVYLVGLRRCFGYTPYMVFPILRFVFRLAPPWLVVRVYRSGRLRNAPPGALTQ